MGAIATGGVRVLNHDVVDSVGLPESVIDQVAAQEAAELERRERLYRRGMPAAINKTPMIRLAGTNT